VAVKKDTTIAYIYDIRPKTKKGRTGEPFQQKKKLNKINLF